MISPVIIINDIISYSLDIISKDTISYTGNIHEDKHILLNDIPYRNIYKSYLILF